MVSCRPTIVPGTTTFADRVGPGSSFEVAPPGPPGPDPDTDLGLEPRRAQGTGEGFVRHVAGLVPAEPTCFGALARRRCGVQVGSEQEKTQVQMGVPVSRFVHVHVDETRPSVRMGELEARLLLRLTPGGLPRLLTGFEMSTGLQPPMQALVYVQHGPATPHHHCRPGDVLEPVPAVQGIGQGVEIGHDASQGQGLAFVAGYVRLEHGSDPRHDRLRPVVLSDRPRIPLRHTPWLAHRRPTTRRAGGNVEVVTDVVAGIAFDVPEDLAAALKGGGLGERFAALASTHRQKYLGWITSARGRDTTEAGGQGHHHGPRRSGAGVTDTAARPVRCCGARARLIDFIAGCSEQQWVSTALGDQDPRPVGVIMDHVADAYEYLASFVATIIRGDTVEVSSDIVDELDAGTPRFRPRPGNRPSPTSSAAAMPSWH